MGDYLHSVWWWFGITIALGALVLMVREEIKKRRNRREKKELDVEKKEIEKMKRKKDWS